MKYGIRITKEDGKVQYAYSAKGGYISATDDITNTALFEQEKSAIAALKIARKDGYESKMKCHLEVVGIEYTVVTVTDVPKPPKKAGFVLSCTKLEQQFGKPVNKPVWFSGPKKAGSDIRWADAIESATVFASEMDAQAKIAECREDRLEAIERKRNELAGGNQFTLYMSPKENAQWAERLKSNIEHMTQEIQWFDTIQIKPS